MRVRHGENTPLQLGLQEYIGITKHIKLYFKQKVYRVTGKQASDCAAIFLFIGHIDLQK
jgi:hypothetical protein